MADDAISAAKSSHDAFMDLASSLTFAAVPSQAKLEDFAEPAGDFGDIPANPASPSSDDESVPVPSPITPEEELAPHEQQKIEPSKAENDEPKDEEEEGKERSRGPPMVEAVQPKLGESILQPTAKRIAKKEEKEEKAPPPWRRKRTLSSPSRPPSSTAASSSWVPSAATASSSASAASGSADGHGQKRSRRVSQEELEELRAEEEAAKEAGVGWQERGPPGKPGDTWRGQRFRPESGKFANRGGSSRAWYSAWYAVKKSNDPDKIKAFLENNPHPKK